MRRLSSSGVAPSSARAGGADSTALSSSTAREERSSTPRRVVIGSNAPTRPGREPPVDVQRTTFLAEATRLGWARALTQCSHLGPVAVLIGPAGELWGQAPAE